MSPSIPRREREGCGLEARRALRVATREMQRHTQPPQPEPDDFPELAATMQASPTRRTPDQDVPTSYIPRERHFEDPSSPEAPAPHAPGYRDFNEEDYVRLWPAGDSTPFELK